MKLYAVSVKEGDGRFFVAAESPGGAELEAMKIRVLLLVQLDVSITIKDVYEINDLTDDALCQRVG